MSTDPHTRVRSLFDAALDVPESDRGALIDTTAAGDHALAAEVRSLLAALDAGGTALDAGATQDLGIAGLSGVDSSAQAPAVGVEINGVSIGGFRLIRLLGSGSMGSVYEAAQGNPARTVALKVMRTLASTPDSRRRFIEEAQILARLRHPGVAQVFAAGTHELAPRTAQDAAVSRVLDLAQAVPWIAMELVESARPITAYADGARLSIRQRLELFLGVCDAVHHGHQRGIIHRDLKPANLLVDGQGAVKVIDFGIARVLEIGGPSDGGSAPTLRGSLIGTLRYMSPEQCDGDSLAVDTRSDVYALGVVLYEILTATAPYSLDGGSFAGAVRTIREAAPVAPSVVNSAIGSDVQCIVLKALEKDRERRYQSAADLADDIRRYLASKPISARPAGVLYRTAKLARRNPVLVGLATVLGLVVLVSIVGISVSLVRALRAEAAAELGRADAERRSYVASIYAAAAAIQASDGGGAQARLAGTPERLRGWEWRHLSALADQSIARIEVPAGEAFYSVSPDGETVIGRFGDDTVRAFDRDLKRQRWNIPWLGQGFEPQFSADGRMAVVTGSDNMLLDTADGRVIRRFDVPKGVRTFGGALSSDGSLVAIGIEGAAELWVFNVHTGAVVFRTSGTGAGFDPDFSPDGRLLAFGEYPETVIVQVGSWKELYRFPTARSMPPEVSKVRFSPDGKMLAVTVGFDIGLHNATDGALLRMFKGHSQRIHSVAFDAAGRYLVSGSVDKSVRLWDVAGTDDPVVLLGHGAAVRFVRFIADPNHAGQEQIWSSDEQPSIRLWNSNPSKLVGGFSFSSGASPVLGLAFDRQSRLLVAARHTEAAVWDAVRGSLASPEQTQPGPSVSINLDERLWAVGVVGEGLSLGELGTLTPRWTVPAHVTASSLVQLSPDGRFVAAGLADGGVLVVRATDGRSLCRIEVPGEKLIARPCFSPDSTQLITGHRDGSGRLTEVATGRELALYHDSTNAVYVVAISEDGRTIALGFQGGMVQLWDVASGIKVRTLSGWHATVWGLAFSPDGTRLAVGSQDRVARIFNFKTGDELLQLRKHSGTVMSLAWSPDGRFLATGGYDQRVYVWDSQPVSAAGPAHR